MDCITVHIFTFLALKVAPNAFYNKIILAIFKMNGVRRKCQPVEFVYDIGNIT